MNDQEFEELLAKKRGDTAPSLYFEPSIELLMDTAYCKTIESVVHKSGRRWERMKATSSLGNSLPDESGLYMFVWYPQLTLRFDNPPKTEEFFWVLYIGKAGKEGGQKATLKNRYLSEYSKYVGKDASCLWKTQKPKTRAERLEHYLTLRPLEYWFLTMDNVDDILSLEVALLDILMPPLNSQFRRKLRASGLPQPAFG